MFLILKKFLSYALLPLIIYGYGISAIMNSLINYDNLIFNYLSQLITFSFSIFTFYFCTKFSVFNKKNFLYLYIAFWFIYIYKLFDSYDFFINITSIADFKILILAIFFSFFPSICLYQKYKLQDINKVNMQILLFFIIFSILFFILIIFKYNNINYFFERINLSKLNSTAICQMASISLILLIFNFINNANRNKYFFIIFANISILIMFFSLSRAIFFSFFLCYIIYLFLNRKNLSFLSIFLFFYLLFSFFLLLLFTNRLKFILTAGSKSDVSFLVRKELIQSGFSAINNSPIFGNSILIDMERFLHPHNILLEAFMSTGVIGGSLIILILVISIINAIKLLSIPRYEWIGAILLHSIFISLFHHAIWMNTFLFAMIIFSHCCLQSRKI